MATVTSIFGLEPWRIGVAVGAVGIWAVVGWIQKHGFPKWPTFKVKPSEPAADPDRRLEFMQHLHWLTEFARNDLNDSEMVADFDKAYQRFTQIREAQAK